jgi:hypothetical protein
MAQSAAATEPSVSASTVQQAVGLPVAGDGEGADQPVGIPLGDGDAHPVGELFACPPLADLGGRRVGLRPGL